MVRLLLLGGTAEALGLARRTASVPKLQTVTSLAGRTRQRADYPGEVRIGGFGGASGLAGFLRDRNIDLVVDATHPFAAVMARNAAQACEETGVPRLKLLRPAWQPGADDLWIETPDAAAAAAALPSIGKRFFLTTGLGSIAVFAGLADAWFLVRLIDRPETALPLAQYELILARGPFAEAAEVTLMRAHGIEALVAKNSGGDSTYAKIAAARRLGLPVVMIRRPGTPGGETVGTVDQALAWIAARTQ